MAIYNIIGREYDCTCYISSFYSSTDERNKSLDLLIHVFFFKKKKNKLLLELVKEKNNDNHNLYVRTYVVHKDKDQGHVTLQPIAPSFPAPKHLTYAVIKLCLIKLA